jgi:hypothetical protein
MKEVLFKDGSVQTLDEEDGPVREIKQILLDSGDPHYVNRLLIGTPSIGMVRMEWVMARYGQIIPMNWSQVQMIQWLSSYVPIRFQLPDAQNLIAKECIEKDFEWLLFIEHDNLLPPDCFIRFNQYMRDAKVPIVSALYFSRSRPSDPLIFRGRGTSVYTKWKPKDLVWADGIPTGCVLIHHSILKAMWDEAEEYVVGNQTTRRIFRQPANVWYDPQTGEFNTTTGTTDLDFCTRVMEGKYFEKAGWKEYQKMKYPFLVDTNIFCKHIDPDGTIYP